MSFAPVHLGWNGASFYNLVTDFYEWGWGQSFHFAPRRKDETFRESIRRAEYVLASRIEVRRRYVDVLAVATVQNSEAEVRRVYS